MKYHEQMKHPLWQKKRLEVLEYNRFQCENCGDKDAELHVHHPFYKRGANVWDYEVHELRCFCHKCHLNEHAIDEQIRRLLADPNVYKERVIGFLKSHCHGPHTKLNSHDEIIGFLLDKGVCTKDNEEAIIAANGIPDNTSIKWGDRL